MPRIILAACLAIACALVARPTVDSGFTQLPEGSERRTIAILDFEGVDPVLGARFADMLASRVAALGIFDEIVRGEPHGEATLILGTIKSFKPGNPALRLKTRGRLGHGRFIGSLFVMDNPEHWDAEEIKIYETTKVLKRDASRTGRESGDWLIRSSADSAASALGKQLAN